MQFVGARWSVGCPGWSPVASRRLSLSSSYEAHNECFRKFGKRCLPPGGMRGMGWG